MFSHPSRFSLRAWGAIDGKIFAKLVYGIQYDIIYDEDDARDRDFTYEMTAIIYKELYGFRVCPIYIVTLW